MSLGLRHDDLMDPADNRIAVYRPGAVAKMVDVPAPTLRSWEERYSLIVPVRSAGGQRLSSRDHVGDSVLDGGHPVMTARPACWSADRASVPVASWANGHLSGCARFGRVQTCSAASHGTANSADHLVDRRVGPEVGRHPRQVTAGAGDETVQRHVAEHSNSPTTRIFNTSTAGLRPPPGGRRPLPDRPRRLIGGRSFAGRRGSRSAARRPHR